MPVWKGKTHDLCRIGLGWTRLHLRHQGASKSGSVQRKDLHRDGRGYKVVCTRALRNGKQPSPWRSFRERYFQRSNNHRSGVTSGFIRPRSPPRPGARRIHLKSTPYPGNVVHVLEGKFQIKETDPAKNLLVRGEKRRSFRSKKTP